MKKLLGILLALTMLAGCAYSLAETDYQELCDANVYLAALKKHPVITQHITIYDAETGEKTNSYIISSTYNPDDGCVHTFLYESGDILVLGYGGGYAYLASRDMPYLRGFIEDDYEKTMQFYDTVSIGEFDQGQTIVGEETLEDGRLLLTIEGVIDENYDDYRADFAGLTLVTHTTVNPESLVIEKNDVYIRGEDGEERLIADVRLEFDPVIELPFDISALMGGETPREIHVIKDAGTDAEAEYVLNAPKNVFMYVSPLDGYQLYHDMEGAEIAGIMSPDENGEYPDIQTFYMKRVAE